MDGAIRFITGSCFGAWIWIQGENFGKWSNPGGKAMAEKEIKEKIRKEIAEMMERNNIRVIRISWWETFCFRHLYPWIRNVKHFFQEHWRGYSDEDCWNVAWFIARKTVPPLQKMRDNFMGTAMRRHTENRHGEIQELKRISISKEPEALSEQQWRDVLDDIIFAFQWPLRMDLPDFDHNSQYVNDGARRQKRGLKLFSIYYNDLWD